MGAWGTGYFQSDEAGDFLSEIVDANDWNVARKAFEDVMLTGDAYLELTPATDAVCGAALVANKVKGLVVTTFAEFIEQIATLSAPPKDLVALALAAVERVERQSELAELWDESRHADEWRQSIATLKDALQP